jgi:hypothetical protein
MVCRASGRPSGSPNQRATRFLGVARTPPSMPGRTPDGAQHAAQPSRRLAISLPLCRRVYAAPPHGASGPSCSPMQLPGAGTRCAGSGWPRLRDRPPGARVCWAALPRAALGGARAWLAGSSCSCATSPPPTRRAAEGSPPRAGEQEFHRRRGLCAWATLVLYERVDPRVGLLQGAAGAIRFPTLEVGGPPAHVAAAASRARRHRPLSSYSPREPKKGLQVSASWVVRRRHHPPGARQRAFVVNGQPGRARWPRAGRL